MLWWPFIGFPCPDISEEEATLHGVKSQGTTKIWAATAKAGKKKVLDSRKEDGVEVNTKNC